MLATILAVALTSAVPTAQAGDHDRDHDRDRNHSQVRVDSHSGSHGSYAGHGERHVRPEEVRVVHHRSDWSPGYRGAYRTAQYRPTYRAGWSWVGGNSYAGRWSPGYWVPAVSRPGFVWVNGYWDNDYYVEGYWRQASRPGYVWTNGYYDGYGRYIVGSWQLVRPRGYVQVRYDRPGRAYGTTHVYRTGRYYGR